MTLPFKYSVQALYRHRKIIIGARLAPCTGLGNDRLQSMSNALILPPLSGDNILRKLLFISAITAFPLASTHAATYKCVEDGQTTYQATPCKGAGSAINVVPPDDAAGYVKGTETDPGTTAAKFDEQSRKLILEQRLRDINYETQKLEAEISGYQSAMQSELDTLQQRKDFWDKQLGGKTQAQSVENEMQTVSEKYKAKIQTAQDKLSELNKEKSVHSSQSGNAEKTQEE